jgi:hypothetical protein
MSLRHAFVFLFLIVLSTQAFAECIGYNDTFDVRVLDGNLKTVDGAQVQVKYDRGSTFGEKYYITPIKLTDASGKIHYDLFNQGTISRTIDCNIVINATSGGTSKSVTVVANQHGPIVDVVIPGFYYFRFYVKDQLGFPLQNASVMVGGKTNKTGSDGMVLYHLKTGSYDYFASYRNAYQSGTLTLVNESNFVVIFPKHKISVDVSDDAGNPLPATLSIMNRTFAMENGHFEETEAYGDEIPFSVEYRGIISEGVIIPVTDPIVEVRYDINSPQIGSIKSDFIGNTYKLQITASDPNTFASGIDPGSIKVFYRVEPADAAVPWSNAVVYTASRGVYTADFPELPKNSIVRFRVEVKDKAGNRAEQEGRFSTAPGSTDTQNGTNTQPPPEEEHGIPLIYIIGGAIIAILAIYLVFRIKSKAGEGG